MEREKSGGGGGGGGGEIKGQKSLNSLEKTKKSKTRMTASILKQNPNTQMVQRITIY